MPNTPSAPEAENIISAIKRLSERSAELRKSAKKNDLEADRLAEHIATLRRKLERIAT